MEPGEHVPRGSEVSMNLSTGRNFIRRRDEEEDEQEEGKEEEGESNDLKDKARQRREEESPSTGEQDHDLQQIEAIQEWLRAEWDSDLRAAGLREGRRGSRVGVVAPEEQVNETEQKRANNSGDAKPLSNSPRVSPVMKKAQGKGSRKERMQESVTVVPGRDLVNKEAVTKTRRQRLHQLQARARPSPPPPLPLKVSFPSK